MSFLDDAMKGVGEAILAPKTDKTPEKATERPIDRFIPSPLQDVGTAIRLGEDAVKNPKGAFAELGTAYCVTQRSDLYYGAMGVGAGVGVIATLVLVLIVRLARGGKAK